MHFLSSPFGLLLFVRFCCSAKILSVFPGCGYSQFILGEKLLQELNARGHDVTVISLFKPKDAENYTTIFLGDVLDTFKSDDSADDLKMKNIISDIIFTYNLGYELTERIVKHEKVQKLIHSDAKFDIVLLEQFFNEAHMGFAKHFNAHLILFSSIGLSEWNQHLTGNVYLPSLYPISFTAYSNSMEFFQRLKNSFVRLFIIGYQELVAYPQQQEYLDKYFPGKIQIKDILHSADLMLLNSDVSIGESHHLNHATIEIGSFHITENALPKNIQTFLDDASDGAIFFSLGTNLKSSDLDKRQINDIIEVFGGLKQKLLWKFENINEIDVPENILISKWLPQSDILAHPNLVLFITHGGLLSTTESVFYGVPMIGIPIFGDQRMNVARSVKNGYSIHLSLQELNAKSLRKAILEVIDNPRYQENARKRSNILRDKQVRPIDNAIFWIEHVLKHNGAPHLRNRALDLNWCQIYLLDVIFFVILSFVITIALLKFGVSRLTYILNSTTKVKPFTKTNKTVSIKRKKKKQY